MQQKTTAYTCDICKRKVVEVNQPLGWVEIERENPMYDRDWIKTDICDECIDRIHLEIEKKK